MSLLCSLACERSPKRRAYVFQGNTMGTTFTVKVVDESLEAASQERLGKLIESELDGVNAKMSHYREDSELSRFNRYRETKPFPLSEQTFEVFRLARQISALTGGAFDVTVGPLVNAWGFGPEAPPERIPTDESIRELLQEVGYEKLELDPGARTVRKTEAQVTCDLSAVAKGYGVDRVAEALDRQGVSDYMIEVGGEVRTLGSNEQGQAWRIGIERPITSARAIQRVVSLSGWALATSGDYRNYYELDGVRYTHLIDPRTGRPITHRLASVTVVDRTCARADGMATALLVLGPDEGYQLAVAQNLAAFFLVHQGESGFREEATPAFNRLARD